MYEHGLHAVFAVSAGLRSGTAFLVDSLGGLLVTNAHVINAQSDISVYVDSATRVPARVVDEDLVADLALLKIDLNRCSQCVGLRLAPAATTLTRPGQHVVALGYPLDEPLSITAGIVSNVQSGAIITDVNLNPGNSGGPLLNLAGEVIAINTFVATEGHGAGIYGAIPVDRLAVLFDHARESLRSMPPPIADVLPVLSSRPYPTRLLKALLDSAKPDAFESFDAMDAGPFVVAISTPVSDLIKRESRFREITHDRAQREAKAEIPQEERYQDEVLTMHDWDTFVGHNARAVISISVYPRIAETLGSTILRSLSRSLLGVDPSATLKYQADVRGVKLHRGSMVVSPLFGGHDPIPVLVADRWVSLKDVADRGYYVYDASVFGPDSAARLPIITLEIADLKEPGAPRLFTLDGYQVARAWNDFAQYYAAMEPSQTFKRYTFSKVCPPGPLGPNNAPDCSFVVNESSISR